MYIFKADEMRLPSAGTHLGEGLPAIDAHHCSELLDTLVRGGAFRGLQPRHAIAHTCLHHRAYAARPTDGSAGEDTRVS